MIKQIRVLGAITLALAFQAGAIAQTTAPLAVSAVQEVQRLAPQLVPFAGSDANFQNLVNGLSQGLPVTLTTITADGFLQTVTFTPASPMSSADIARLLETARQQLIARGIANPTAEQIGVTIAGGTLPTPSGTAPVSGLLTTLTPGGLRASVGASRPPSAILGTANPPSNLAVDIRPITPQPPAASASAGTTTSAGTPSSSPVVRFISDTTRTGNISDTPLPSSAGTPTINSSTGVSNGGPSPAVQMQGRR